MLEDLNTVHGLTKEIERLRAGEEDGARPETRLTAGQLWKRLLELNEQRRIEMVRSLLESADEGSRCSMEMHDADLRVMQQRIGELADRLDTWKVPQRLLIRMIRELRRDQEAEVECGTVADRLELILAGGEGPARRIICGHAWTEMGEPYTCAEYVGLDGDHPGGHHAYVSESFAVDTELRMRYLEEENDALRKRLGLPLNAPRNR